MPTPLSHPPIPIGNPSFFFNCRPPSTVPTPIEQPPPACSHSVLFLPLPLPRSLSLLSLCLSLVVQSPPATPTHRSYLIQSPPPLTPISALFVSQISQILPQILVLSLISLRSSHHHLLVLPLSTTFGRPPPSHRSAPVPVTHKHQRLHNHLMPLPCRIRCDAVESISSFSI